MLTKKQNKILNFIEDFQKDFGELPPPTLMDIKLGLSKKEYKKFLKDNGYTR